RNRDPLVGVGGNPGAEGGVLDAGAAKAILGVFVVPEDEENFATLSIEVARFALVVRTGNSRVHQSGVKVQFRHMSLSFVAASLVTASAPCRVSGRKRRTTCCNIRQTSCQSRNRRFSGENSSFSPPILAEVDLAHSK